MKLHEINLVRALSTCSFLPGHPHKRFVRDMAFQADSNPSKPLTERQRQYLDVIAWRYRRQMPQSLVTGQKPLDLLPRQAVKAEILRKLEPEAVQGELLMLPQLPPVFLRRLDL